MDITNKSRKEIEQKIDELEQLIARKGVGSDYLSKAERIQRDLNLALMLGGAAALVGISAWVLFKSKND